VAEGSPAAQRGLRAGDVILAVGRSRVANLAEFRRATEGAQVQAVDGVRVLSEDGWWLLRASNTQAVLVARAEASTAAGLERLKASLAAQITASGLEVPDFSGENAGH
jgi:phosphomannomutase